MSPRDSIAPFTPPQGLGFVSSRADKPINEDLPRETITIATGGLAFKKRTRHNRWVSKTEGKDDGPAETAIVRLNLTALASAQSQADLNHSFTCVLEGLRGLIVEWHAVRIKRKPSSALLQAFFHQLGELI